MADPTLILERLRLDPTHRDLLANLLLDALMDTPADSLLRPEELVQSAHLALRTLAANPQTLASLIEEIDKRVQAHNAESLEQTLGDIVPMTLVVPLQKLLGDPVSPSRPILAAMMDHPGMRQLIEELLTHELAAFGRKVRKLVPDAPSKVPGGRLASRIAGVAKGVASAVGSELEKQMEERTRDFVDGALSHSTTRMIDRMASQDYAPQLATWRVDVLHALLTLPLSEFRGEWNKLDKDALSKALADLADAVVQWEGLRDFLQTICDELWPSIAGRTLHDALSPVDAVQTATDQMRAPLARMLQRVLDTPRFEQWLMTLHQS